MIRPLALRVLRRDAHRRIARADAKQASMNPRERAFWRGYAQALADFFGDREVGA